MSKLTVVCEGFTPWRRNTLCGFATILIAELKLRIHDVAIHQKGAARWAQLPAKPLIRDGEVVKDASGKTQYACAGVRSMRLPHEHRRPLRGHVLRSPFGAV